MPLRSLRPKSSCFLLFALISLNAFAQQMPGPDQFSGMKWRLLGPFRAGRVTAVAGIPGDPTTFYFGTPGGGVWKSTDGGRVWSPIFDSVPVPSIGAVTVAPSASKIRTSSMWEPVNRHAARACIVRATTEQHGAPRACRMCLLYRQSSSTHKIRILPLSAEIQLALAFYGTQYQSRRVPTIAAFSARRTAAGTGRRSTRMTQPSV